MNPRILAPLLGLVALVGAAPLASADHVHNEIIGDGHGGGIKPLCVQVINVQPVVVIRQGQTPPVWVELETSTATWCITTARPILEPLGVESKVALIP